MVERGLDPVGGLARFELTTRSPDAVEADVQQPAHDVTVREDATTRTGIDEVGTSGSLLDYRGDMPDTGAAALEPITQDEIASVAEFLQTHLNPKVSQAAWAAAMAPPWSSGPNHGFLLRSGDAIVGAYLAIYSERSINGDPEKFCNLAAWCVLDDYRADGLRLLRRLLGQQGYHFTDLSPSGNVVAINARLKFQPLDTTTAALPNLPWPLPSRCIRVTSRSDVLARTLTGREGQVYSDHRTAAAARHVLVRRGTEHCHVILRRDRRKRLPGFGSVLYVSNPALLREAWRQVSRHLLVRHGMLVTLAELRVVGSRPPGSTLLRKARPKMFRSDRLAADQIDYLYSELTCVAW